MDSGLSLLFCEVPHFSLLLKLELFRDHPSLMIAFSSFLWYYFMGILADHASYHLTISFLHINSISNDVDFSYMSIIHQAFSEERFVERSENFTFLLF